MNLPEPEGEPVTVQEKVYVPCKEHPDYNSVGRLLGPRGMTAKQLEQETGCKIMVRGRGSMRDRRNKPNGEHLDDDLHVLVQCEDTPNRVSLKLKIAVEQIKKLLVPAREGEDDLKRKQLTELAILNGTYRPVKQQIRTQSSFDAAALTSFSMGKGDYQPQSSAFAAPNPLINATPLPNSLQPYLLDSATISPSPSTGSEHH
ncbi:Female germline-specific tumor suppressor gld-1 [Toxocara canis]|uniref:Female germline-specific tumor suppressor gld-1 n=1 Tax=Toxocara canis TaxID=6265 RepID=A0A0B2VDI0_TOXCA|nr:Female germline-specific tumor suppressor gld-1 [Toxocara canis]